MRGACPTSDIPVLTGLQVAGDENVIGKRSMSMFACLRTNVICSYCLRYRHAFDFDEASEAFRAHLRGEGVDFSPEETSSTVSVVPEDRYPGPACIHIPGSVRISLTVS